MDDKTKQVIRDVIKSNFILTLGTIVEGNCNLCSVFYVTENYRTLYFKSRTTSHHAQSLAITPQAAISIYNPSSNYSVKSGIQAIGKVERIYNIAEMANALKLYIRAFKGSENKFESLSNLVVQSVKSTIYKFTIETIKVLDSGKDLHTEEYETFD